MVMMPFNFILKVHSVPQHWFDMSQEIINSYKQYFILFSNNLLHEDNDYFHLIKIDKDGYNHKT